MSVYSVEMSAPQESDPKKIFRKSSYVVRDTSQSVRITYCENMKLHISLLRNRIQRILFRIRRTSSMGGNSPKRLYMYLV